MDDREYQRWEGSFLEVANKVFPPFLGGEISVSDGLDFYPGQRFYMECFFPDPWVIFLEMDLSFKKKLVQKVFHKDWDEISPVIRDDCFLEFLNMIQQLHVGNIYGRKNIYYRHNSPLVLYDIYEDDLEVSTLDLYRFDFSWEDLGLSILIGLAPDV